MNTDNFKKNPCVSAFIRVQGIWLRLEAALCVGHRIHSMAEQLRLKSFPPWISAHGFLVYNNSRQVNALFLRP